MPEPDNALNFWPHKKRKWWVAVLFILTTTLYAARVAMPVCATAISKEYGWNKVDLGAVMGSFFWGYLTTQVLGGYIADRIGGDKVLLFSVVVWGSLTMLTPLIAYFHSMYASTLVLLTSVRVLLGISQGVHYPSMVSLLSQKIPERERSFPNGIITSASNFGILVCGGVGSMILDHYGWIFVFYVIGTIALFITYVLYILTHPSHKEFLAERDLNYKQIQSEKVPWRVLLTNSTVLCLIFAHMCLCNFAFTVLSWLPTYFHENYSNKESYIYNTIPWIMSVPASVLSGWIGERLIQAKWSVGFTRKLMQGIALIGSGFFIVVLSFCTEFVSAVIIASIALSLNVFHHSGCFSNPQDLAPNYAGSLFGVMNGSGALAGFFGVYLTGCLLHEFESWFVVFAYLGLINAIGAVVFIIGGTGNRLV